MEPRPIGPAGMSGRIAALDVQGSGPNVIWVGAATGGVRKSVISTSLARAAPGP